MLSKGGLRWWVVVGGVRVVEECLRLGVSRSPGNLRIAGRRRGMSSCPSLSVDSS